MIVDTLIRFPSQDDEIAFSKSVGLRDEDGVMSPDFHSSPWTIDLIGAHSYVAEDGDEPTEVPGYWAMLKSDSDVEVPQEIYQIFVQRNPADPTIPNRKWAGE